MKPSESTAAENDVQRTPPAVPSDRPPALRFLLLPALGLAALTAIVLFEPLFGDACLLSMDNRIVSPFRINAPRDEPPRPMNIDSIDINAFIMPEAITASARCKAGEKPLWNECEALGVPLYAGMGFLPYYPTAVLYYLMDPLRAYAVALALHLVLLGVGTCLFFMRKGLTAIPALFGAVLVMLCGFVAVRFHSACLVQAASWYPWLLLASDRLIDRPTPRAAAALALWIGLSLLGGFPQIAFLSLYAAAAYFAVGWVRRSRRLGPLLCGLAAVVSGALLSAVLMLPAAEFLSESTRSNGLSRDQWHVKSLEPVAAVRAMLPRFFGDPVQRIDWKDPAPRSLETFPTYGLTTPDNQNVFTENTFYMGCIPLVLLLIGLGRAGAGKHAFALCSAAAALGIAFGAPFLSDAARLLPGVSSGIPKRALWIASFSLAWLAAATAASLLRSPSRRHSLALGAAGLVLAGLGALSFLPFASWVLPGKEAADLSWFQGAVTGDLRRAGLAGIALLVSALLLRRSARRLAVIMLAAGGCIEVASFARAVNPPQPREGQYASPPAVQWLEERGADGGGRILSFKDPGVLPGSIAQVYGIRSLNGYMPLMPRRTAELLRLLDPDLLQVDDRVVGALRDESRLRSPLLDLCGVRYVVCNLEGYRALQPPVAEEAGLHLRYMNRDEVLAVYEREGALPLAFTVGRVRVEQDKDARLEALASPSFDPKETALVEDVPRSLEERALTQGQVAYRRVSPERIELKVRCPGEGFVVVSEADFPGWEARVDGSPVPLIRTDHALMGVALPAGARSVEIAYEPASFAWGAILSGLGALLCLLLFFMPRAGRGGAARAPAGPSAPGEARK